MTFIEADASPGRKTGHIRIHGPEAFEGMRKAGWLAAEALDLMVDAAKPGVATDALDKLAYEFGMDHGAYPAPLDYRGYRKSICTSINHVVCHGIPDSKQLRDGDIVNIDVTYIADGWHGDSSRMYFIGEVPRKAQRLCEVTYEALCAASPSSSRARPPATSATPSSPSPKPSAVPWCANSAATAWAPVPRRAQHPALRPQGPGRNAQGRHVLHYRADDQSRQAAGEDPQ